MYYFANSNSSKLTKSKLKRQVDTAVSCQVVFVTFHLVPLGQIMKYSS